jgi:hypothetical protein
MAESDDANSSAAGTKSLKEYIVMQTASFRAVLESLATFEETMMEIEIATMPSPSDEAMDTQLKIALGHRLCTAARQFQTVKDKAKHAIDNGFYCGIPRESYQVAMKNRRSRGPPNRIMPTTITPAHVRTNRSRSPRRGLDFVFDTSCPRIVIDDSAA